MEDGTTATSTLDSTLYEVKLEVFEGPLDLLLYLIRKDELDIYDIPIAHITSEYLAFLQDVHRLDVEQASEFILMAATLMKVKSQLMLPREGDAAEAGTEGDPREELVRRLLEYQQYKEIAEWLGIQKKAQNDRFLRRQGLDEAAPDGVQLQPVSLFALLRVFKHVLDTVPPTLVHEVIDEQVTVEQCIVYVLAVLEKRTRVRFLDLVEGRDRVAMVATFVGLLELLKSRRVGIQQARPFGDIWIRLRPDAAKAAGVTDAADVVDAANAAGVADVAGVADAAGIAGSAVVADAADAADVADAAGAGDPSTVARVADVADVAGAGADEAEAAL
jgi:segregation and condensation protein A